MSEYLDFKLTERKPKTIVYQMLSKHRGDTLGTIKWHGPWRQYCFYPALDTIFSAGCLSDIHSFLQDHNRRQREKKTEGSP